VLIPGDLNFCGDEVESNFPRIRIERNWKGSGWRGTKFFKRDPSLTLFAQDNVVNRRKLDLFDAAKLLIRHCDWRMTFAAKMTFAGRPGRIVVF
jgi:hypothetical protein